MATTIAITPAIKANHPMYSAAVMLATTGYTSAMMPAMTSSTPRASDQPGESDARGCAEVDMEGLPWKQALLCVDTNFSMASQTADACDAVKDALLPMCRKGVGGTPGGP